MGLADREAGLPIHAGIRFGIAGKGTEACRPLQNRPALDTQPWTGIVLLVSSWFTILTAGAGAFTLALGFVHLRIPHLVGYRPALTATDGCGTASDLPTFRLHRFTYRLRSDDLVGVTWVMSNAASYVLITVALLDLAWAVGWRGIPIGVGASWIAGWWITRSVSQFAIGRRAGDVLVAAWFAALAAWHAVLAFALELASG